MSPDDEHNGLRVVIPHHVITDEVDSRGRITLGAEFANRRVRVAVYRDIDGPIDAGRVPDLTETFTTSERGRFSLGTTYAGERVVLAVVDSDPLMGKDD